MSDFGTAAAWEFGWEALVAIGTLGLALSTVVLAWSTRALAVASRNDQRAQWRPVVIVGENPEVAVSTDDDGRDLLSARLRNVGRGPAFAVQAQLRFDKAPAGASPPQSRILVPGEGMDLQMRVAEQTRRDIAERRQPFPPSLLEIEVSYYDIEERWHHAYLTATRSEVVRKLVELWSAVPPASSAPHGSVTGANQVREDRRNRDEEGIWSAGRDERAGVGESAACGDSRRAG
jgi:hypothetical protein